MEGDFERIGLREKCIIFLIVQDGCIIGYEFWFGNEGVQF